MSRRSLFYVVNLIFPCLLIYAVSFLGFFLPPESGDKVNLEITVLLALVVFLLIAGETLPPTPDAIPALGPSRAHAVSVTKLHLRDEPTNKQTDGSLFKFVCVLDGVCAYPCARFLVEVDEKSSHNDGF